MNERPIIMTAESVRAILAGRKTQTRRIAKFTPTETETGLNVLASSLRLGTYFTGHPESGWVLYSMRGSCWNQVTKRLLVHQPGTILWVRETWARSNENVLGYVYRADGDDVGDTETGKWSSAMFMPRSACRLRLTVISTCIQRLQFIRESDAIAEGIEVDECHHVVRPDDYINWGGAVWEYATLWNRINGKKRDCAWKDNPWVVVIEFEVAPIWPRGHDGGLAVK